MKASIQTITPAIAKRYLEKNSRNRDLRMTHVWKLAKMMERGTWKENGEPIHFNGDDLINGQHRLHAIIKSGKAYRCVVVREVPSDAFTTYGKNALPRSTADTFKHLEEKYYAESAAFFTTLLDYLFGGKRTSRRHSCIIDDHEKLRFLDDYPTSREAIKFASSHKKDLRKLLAQSNFSVLAFLSSFTPKFDWKGYWSCVATGTDMPLDSAARLYRRMLTNNMHTTNRKMRPELLMGYGVLAFNKDLRGESVTRLKMNVYPEMINVPNSELLEFFQLSEEEQI